MEVVAELFHAAAPGTPVRLACLTNTVLLVEPYKCHELPEGLLGRDPGLMSERLLSASEDELCALFRNPALSSSFVTGLLERRKGWEGIDDERLCRFVSLLSFNPRMHTTWEDGGWINACTEDSYASALNAAWALAATAPINDHWAFILSQLYRRLKPEAFDIKNPLDLAARWRLDSSRTNHEQIVRRSYEIRKGLARLALSKNRNLLNDLLASNDEAFRAAAYSSGELTPDQLQVGFEKDGQLAYEEAYHNSFLWRKQATRQAIWTLVRNVDTKNSDWLEGKGFDLKVKALREKKPAWFADEEKVDDQAPATKEDLSAIAAHMERQSQRLETIGEVLRRLMSRAGWIVWFSLGALVASFRHF